MANMKLNVQRFSDDVFRMDQNAIQSAMTGVKGAFDTQMGKTSAILNGFLSQLNQVWGDGNAENWTKDNFRPAAQELLNKFLESYQSINNAIFATAEGTAAAFKVSLNISKVDVGSIPEINYSVVTNKLTDGTEGKKKYEGSSSQTTLARLTGEVQAACSALEQAVEKVGFMDEANIIQNSMNKCIGQVVASASQFASKVDESVKSAMAKTESSYASNAQSAQFRTN